MIILGIVLLVLGLLLKISILWTIGIILVVIGAILAIARRDRSRHRRPQALVLIPPDGVTVHS